jgi:glucose-1-phosphate adenylyltransferase
LKLTTPSPPFNFYDPAAPIYTHARFLPGSVVEDSQLKDVLLTDGCRIRKAQIEHSIIGVRSQVASGSHIKNSILMGADYFDADTPAQAIPLGIGPNCYIEGAILDKNVRLGEGVVIRPFPSDKDLDRETWFVRDGIVVVPKNTIIPPGAHISPEKG